VTFVDGGELVEFFPIATFWKSYAHNLIFMTSFAHYRCEAITLVGSVENRKVVIGEKADDDRGHLQLSTICRPALDCDQ
jgi:hypothetical protein